MNLFRRRTATPVRPRRAREAPADEPPPGCGWFESSHELQQGLQVHEHASPDAVAAQLPLADWIALHLAAGCKPETRMRDDPVLT